MNNSTNFTRDAKKNLARAYVDILRHFDPEFSKHLLEAQRQLLLAAAAFCTEEAKHVEKAKGKMGE